MNKLIIIIGILIILSAMASAQEMPGKERIQSYKMWELTKSLNLDEPQGVKFFPVYNRMDNLVENHIKKEQELVKILQDNMNKPQIEQNIISKITKEILEERHVFQQQKEQLDTELYALLSPEQIGHYIIFEKEFPRKLRQILDERQQQGNPGNQQKPGREQRPRNEY